MEKNKKSNGFLKGATIIATGGFIAKLLGAVYRIPLTNLIGGHGIGLYQMVYPVYCILLTLSATGIPSSIAKLTAERLAKGEGDKPLFKTAIKLFLWIGFAGTLFMAIIAPFLASAQNAKEITAGYFTLAPSVLLVSALSVFRGWFQGKNEMFPTAVSEVIEQGVKVGVGLLFAYLFRDNIVRAVVFLLLAVSISELIALIVMIIWFRRVPAPRKLQDGGGRVSAKSVLKLSVPVTLSSILLPLSALLDSVLSVRLLGAYSPDPVALYGLFSGGAVTVINLPVSICYGVAAASVPALSRAKAKREEGDKKGASVRKKLFFSLGITALIAGVCALGLFFFAQPIAELIYRSLQGEEKEILIKLIKIFSISALTLSLVQTLSACLTAQGKPQYAALSMAIAVVVKTITYTFLLQNPKISVFGLAHATNLCYLVAFCLDLLYNLIVAKTRRKEKA